MKISLYFCLAVVLILMLCLLGILILYQKMRHQYECIHDSYLNLEKLNCELRVQRHDYLNHLQVVYGMMELEEYEELHAYLEPLYKDMMKTGKALKTSIPAVNALLKAKMGEAEGAGIDFYIEVKSDLKHLEVEAWELCKVLSNLIDNAITALGQLDKEIEKKLIVDITEDKESYLFSISNNGPAIPKEIGSAIFRQGFTTKKEAGHGMGLVIVSEVLKKNKGQITFSSDEAETVFVVNFEKGKKELQEKKGGKKWMQV